MLPFRKCFWQNLRVTTKCRENSEKFSLISDHKISELSKRRSFRQWEWDSSDIIRWTERVEKFLCADIWNTLPHVTDMYVYSIVNNYYYSHKLLTRKCMTQITLIIKFSSFRNFVVYRLLWILIRSIRKIWVSEVIFVEIEIEILNVYIVIKILLTHCFRKQLLQNNANHTQYFKINFNFIDRYICNDI